MKTAELEGAALDWAVAKCAEEPVRIRGKDVFESDNQFSEGKLYCPSESWEQGGPIIEREKISIKAQQPDWSAYIAICDGMTDRVLRGTTPLIAAMRCYVASKLGDEVEIPEELK